jgi:hypothetical protein
MKENNLIKEDTKLGTIGYLPKGLKIIKIENSRFDKLDDQERFKIKDTNVEIAFNEDWEDFN